MTVTETFCLLYEALSDAESLWKGILAYTYEDVKTEMYH
jgi:hypothetical protein